MGAELCSGFLTLKCCACEWQLRKLDAEEADPMTVVLMRREGKKKKQVIP